jgi:type II secretory pathway component PulC
MTPLFAVLALVLSGAVASPARLCAPAKPDARVHVSFLADSDLASLAKWAKEATCVEYTFESALAGRRLAQGVILTVTGRDAGAIFEILLHTMNLRSYGHGAKRSIVAAGPETAQSKTANEKEKVDVERDKVLANLHAEIKRKDDSHYTITRRGADAVITSLPSIARTIRIAPEAKGGKPIGFRLVSLKPGAILTRVGFQNGDVILSLNGNDLTSPDKALEAYTKFRTTGVMRAGFLRANKPLAVEIKIE